jgi:hypothetical protein
MARRITAPSEAALSRVKMRIAISRLKRRIVDLRAFDPATLNDRYDARIGVLECAIDKVLVLIFGVETVEYRRYSNAKRLDRAGHFIDHMPLKEIREGFERVKNDSISLLKEIITQIKAKLELTI